MSRPQTPGAEVRVLQQPAEDRPASELALVSVVMPAYNEELVLAANLERTYRYLAEQAARYDFELIVVNDASTDSTGEIADRFARDHPKAQVVHHTRNGQLGRAVRSGFRACRGDYVVTLDSDLTYDAAHVDLLLDALVSHNAHVAVASPYMPGGQVSGVPAVRLALSRAANRYLSAAVHGRLHTLTCMVRAYDGELIRNLNLRCAGTDINTEILYKAEVLGARIVEVPAHLDWASAAKEAPARVSSVRLGRSIRQYLRAGVVFRPSGPFALAAALSTGATLLLATLLVTLAVRAGAARGGDLADRVLHALQYPAQQHLTLLVVALALGVLSVQLAGFAFLARQARRSFEELFDLTTRSKWEADSVELWGSLAGTAVPRPHGSTGAVPIAPVRPHAAAQA